jgi:putative transposase
MPSQTPAPCYKRHRFPKEIISHAVWLYYRFTLSFRDIEEMLAQRGITLTYETARYWCHKFGQSFANAIRRQRHRPGDRWHIDEVFLRIGGKTHYLFRAVDQDGEVLDILLLSRRNKKAAVKFFGKLLKRQGYAPRTLVTDKLKSYSAAQREVLRSVEHRSEKRDNNRFPGDTSPERCQRPGRELPSAHARTRAQEAPVQVHRPRPTVPVHPRSDLLLLPSRPPPDAGAPLPCAAAPAVRLLERPNGCQGSVLRAIPTPAFSLSDILTAFQAALQKRSGT